MKKEIPKCPKCGSEVKLVDAKLGEPKGISVKITYKYMCPKCFFTFEVEEEILAE